MTKEVFLTIFRQALVALSSIFGTTFAADGELVNTAISGIVAVAAIVWGIIAKARDQKQING